MLDNLKVITNWLTKQIVAVLIALALGYLVIDKAWTYFESRESELKKRESELFQKEIKFAKQKAELEVKAEQLDLKAKELTKLKNEIDRIRSKNDEGLRKTGYEKHIENQRVILQQYVDKYLTDYSHVDFGESVGCNVELYKTKKKAEALLDIIYQTAQTSKLAFSHFIKFVQKQRGTMIVVESFDDCNLAVETTAGELHR
ncbi:hypothetical protein [Aliikangiella coralliicola]|uniref:Uncharacterized protein n=1 Tax=Aliikangiella coralliicola TaxID=2592383 RepID=A0A545UC11_9GAMM|nr:hypothetical protein [Aliikangiella coralliicola]TQV87011.1 hypothetical protein FLL46_14485 [Aliikangiella coralliicola]